MKKFIAITWMIFFCCSTANAEPPQFSTPYKSSVGPIYEYYADFGTTSGVVSPGTVVDTPGLTVRVQNIPGLSGDLTLYYLAGFNNYFPYVYAINLNESQGYLPPGSVYERDYVFYIDLNNNGSLDTGEPRDAFTLASGSIRNMAFITDFSITPGNHPTVTWKKITAYDDLLYRVRIYPIIMDSKNNGSPGYPDRSNLIFQSGIVTPLDGTFTYDYTGDLFDQYYVLAVCVEAIQVVDGGRIPYRSRYFINHSKYFSSTVPGDMNGDNKLDLKDVVTGLRVISNIQ